MTLRDRTLEFTDLTETIKQRSAPQVVRRPNKTYTGSEFGKIATQIKHDINSTTDKLERLTKLAKRKSLFDDPTIEIQELTTVINQDIKNLNNQIALLQQQQNSAYGRPNKQVETHTSTIVKSLKNKLQKTTKGFTQILEIRTENLKQQQKERESFTGAMSPNFSKRAVGSPLYKPTYSPIPQEDPDNNNSMEVSIAMPQQVLLTQDRYLSSRADAVASIERTIGELQNIFRNLATLVAEQQEQIERIDRDIDATSMNVVSAQNHLLKYLANISSNRWLAIKVFLVLIFFMIVFVVFFV